MTDSIVKPFVYRPRFVWVDYPTEAGEDDVLIPDPDYAGFRVRVLANPMGAQVRDEQKQWAAWQAGEISEADYLASITHRISEWNLSQEDDDGNVIPVPCPGDADENLGAWYLLGPTVMYWLVGQIRTMHFPKARAATPSTRSESAGTTDTPIPQSTIPAATPLAS